jgi:hypothetical protein
MRHAFILVLLTIAFWSSATVFAQEQKKFTPPAARLAAAKTAAVVKGEGSDIPFNVIYEGIEGWGRFTIVKAADQADVIIEIDSPEDSSSSVTTKTSTATDGRPDYSSTSSRSLSVSDIKLTVRDSKSHMVLWTGSERPKSAFKKKAQEDNLIEAAQRLLSKFHDGVEPVPAQ